MKISNAVIILLAVSIVRLQAQTLSVAAGSQTTVPPPTDYQVVQQDGNSQVWQRETYEQETDGQVVTNVQAYTELATGLNHLVGNQWEPSLEEINILPDGSAGATNGQHSAYFPIDIYNGEIELVTPGGMQIKSQPVGLCYDDGTNTVFIAVLTNSVGQLLGANQVVYTNAFTGVDADIVYTYTKAGLEQDIVLRTQPAAPGDFNMTPDDTRLQLMTEFFNVPQPGTNETMLPEQAGMTLSDESLNFGTMQMVPGKAFVLGEDTPLVQVGKSWVSLDGRQFLVEAVPVAAMADELESLPLPTTQARISTTIKTLSKKLVLPPQHLVKRNAPPMKLATLDLRRKPGVVLDYVTVNSTLTNFTFQGDTTYYISGSFDLWGTNNLIEGGTIIKFTNNASILVNDGSTDPAIQFSTSAYRPAIFTSKDDNSVGNTISGSTGSPTGYYANPALGLTAPSFAPNIAHFRIAYAKEALSLTGVSPLISCGQFLNCQDGIVVGGANVNLENILFGNVLTNFNVGGGSVQAQNVTFSGSSCVVARTSPLNVNCTNCLFANVTNLTNGVVTLAGAFNGFYNSPEFGSAISATTVYPFQTVGAGSYYLTNGCNFHNAGTTNVATNLLADLNVGTTYPPLIYSNVVFSVPTTLSPQAQRDNTGIPDLGYHYDPLDYIVGGCDLSTNLTFSADTAVGWFYSDDHLYGTACAILLNRGANLTFSGTATSPCWMARFTTVQEGENGVWPLGSSAPGVQLTGDGTGTTPQLNAQFSKWSVLADDAGHFQDDYALGNVSISDSEFYIANIVTYKMSYLYFTNCLFYRAAVFLFDQDAAPVFTMNDSTYYDGIIAAGRSDGQTQFWTIENTSFDGTGFRFADYYNGSSSYTLFNYNAYNTNNLSGLTIPYPYGATTNILEVNGPNTVMVTNYNWQTSWFGNFYLPTNSPLIRAGSTTANLLGLYHFTTQTNQTVEGDSQVDIGYHYVATGTNGIPLDTNGDGIPDYLEDANGNGLVDSGEIGWNLTNDLGLTVIISQPRNGSTLP
jgi:hypothetical protein